MSNKSKDDFRNWMNRNVDLRIENENRDMPTKGSIEDIENRANDIIIEKIIRAWHNKIDNTRVSLQDHLRGHNI